MNKVKNTIAILLVMFLSIIFLSSSVNAASTSIGTSATKVNVGNSVSITVSFGESVSAAQFVLNYDSNRFRFVSCSKGEFSGNTYAYLSTLDAQDLSSVTFKFTALTTGTGTFNLSGLVLPNKSNTVSRSSVNVTVQNATGSKNNNTNKTPTPTQNVEEPQITPEIVGKYELEQLLIELDNLIETDYTVESWGALQDAINKAKSATTNADYDAVKELLTTDSLVIQNFEKTELTQILRALIGKVEADYTEESWKNLQEAIEKADNAKLASEYDEVKDKLTLDILEAKGKGFDRIINFFQGLDDEQRISLALAVCVAVLLLIIIIMIILFRREKRRTESGARRLK